MVLQSTGPISVGNVATEYGGIAPHLLSAEYAAKIGKVAGQIIKLSDFFGKANAPTWVTNPALGTYGVGGTFSITLSATATGPVTYAIVTYPSPVFGSISGSTFSGTVPTGKYGTNVYSWVISATSGGSTNRTFTMTVSSTAPVWTTSSIGSFKTSTAFNVALVVTSDSAVTVTKVSGATFGTVSGKNISGTTPSTAGTYTWVLRATDAELQTTDRSVSVTVLAPVAPGWSFNYPASYGYSRDANGYILIGTFPGGSSVYWYIGCDIGDLPITYNGQTTTPYLSAVLPNNTSGAPLQYNTFTITAQNAVGSASQIFSYYVY